MKRGPAKTPTHYYDDVDEGPTKLTSHPNFVRLCSDELFYSCDDEFAPFGSDSGSDTLSDLEDWFRERRGKVRAFIDRTLLDWDMKIPDLAETRKAIVVQWLNDSELAVFLPEIDQLLIAAAFGQYKIIGSVEEPVRELAIAAAKREVIATAFYERANPNWKHAKTKAKAETRILAALEAMGTEST